MKTLTQLIVTKKDLANLIVKLCREYAPLVISLEVDMVYRFKYTAEFIQKNILQQETVPFL